MTFQERIERLKIWWRVFNGRHADGSYHAWESEDFFYVRCRICNKREEDYGPDEIR